MSVHDEAIASARAAEDEDFFADLLPEAAELIISSQLGSMSMLQRKMRVTWSLAADLMLELHELGVVGPAMEGRAARDVLVPLDGLAEVLAEIARIATTPDAADLDSLAPPRVVDAMPASQPPGATPPRQAGDRPGGVVSLVKPTRQPPPASLDGRPGVSLAIRQPASLAPTASPLSRRPVRQVARARLRQAATAPAVTRAKAVGRQLPAAPVRLVWRSPRGATRLVKRLIAYLRDDETIALLVKHAEAAEGDAHAKADVTHRQRLVERRWRVGVVAVPLVVIGLAWWAPDVLGWLAGLAVFATITILAPRKTIEDWLTWLATGAGAGVVAWWGVPKLAALVPYPPWWAWLAAGGVAVVVCGLVGRGDDQPPILVVPSGPSTHAAPTITAPMVRDALCRIGIAALKDPDQIRIIQEPHRNGPGVQIDLELPTAAAEVIAQRERLAAVLLRELGCVWPEVGRLHAAHLRLYVSDEPMSRQEQDPWPLASATRPIDVFEKQPMFTTKVGKWMRICPMFVSILIGAVPRVGKTFILRQIGLIFALDIRARLYLLDGKGMGDLNSLKSCAHFISRGGTPEEVEGRVLPMLRELRAELYRRAKVINDLPDEEVPESKVTTHLADRRELGLYPVFLGMDETQTYYLYGSDTSKDDKAVRAEIIEITTELAKLGPACGFVFVGATQNICGETVPRQISLTAMLRIALKVVDSTANNKILGDGAYGRGIDATAFDRTDLGVAWIAGEGETPEIGRSVYGLDAPTVRRIAERAAGWRRAAGLLTGQAAGESELEAEVVYDLVQDAERVMTERGCGKAQWGELVPWLRDLRDQYARLTEEELSAGVRAAGVPVRDVRSGDSVRKGVYISDLRKCGGRDVA